jgi:membrane protease subunit HflC
MSGKQIAAIIVIVLLVIVGLNSVFIVNQKQRAILFALGEIKRTDFKPGLYLKVPFVNNVRKYERRLMTMDSKPERILTGEKKNVLVDYYVKWYISDVAQYYRSLGGREDSAKFRMSQIIKDALQAELGNRTIREVVSGERKEIMVNVAKAGKEKLAEFGLTIVDVRIKQIELPQNVQNSVFDRMRAERERIAKEHRAEGEKAARIIKAGADRKRVELLADARRKAEKIRGAGDAKATQIYAEAYSQDPKFYGFYRSLEAYRKSFEGQGDFLVLEPDSEFFEYFKQSPGK